MGRISERLYFDKRDLELLEVVREVLDGGGRKPRDLRRLLEHRMHPHGIKEMAASTGIRIAYAVISVLGSLDSDKCDERLDALRGLQKEVLSASGGLLRLNTARVLLQIMKELVRERESKIRMLKLARDFRLSATGKPLVIRRQLRKYHLLEMPESWNQMAFDDHVHDASTKGRKSASHLIMDAWIKGIRHVVVVFYNQAPPQAVEELLEAGEIMGVTVRIGIEFAVTFYDRYVKLIWLPRGFEENGSLVRFFHDLGDTSLMLESKEVSEYWENYVLDLLQSFNDRHLQAAGERYNVDVQPLSKNEFLDFVYIGQPSVLHLEEFICFKLRERMPDVPANAEDEHIPIPESIYRDYLAPELNPDLPNPYVPSKGSFVPDFLKQSPAELAARLNAQHSTSRLTLDIGNLEVEDVLEILYDCRGRITHLEIFSLKDYVQKGKEGIKKRRDVCELQQAINTGNVGILKTVVQKKIRFLEATPWSDQDSRVDWDRKIKFVEILFDLEAFQKFYRSKKLRSRVGSNSAGRSRFFYGMGMVIVDSLPPRVKRVLSRDKNRTLLPVFSPISLQKRYLPGRHSGLPAAMIAAMRGLPGCGTLGSRVAREWVLDKDSVFTTDVGNVATLGGRKTRTEPTQVEPAAEARPGAECLNSRLINILKIGGGFVPAFLTFYLTKDWWVLIYFGAVIWFAITGLRNVLQSVLGGGGLRRSPLLRWNSYVSWSRISDSLLYTGFSVPLLDYLVKMVLLDEQLNINTGTAPVALYTIMALVNGLYISTHNAVRGLPAGAVFGNFFRSILSIPLALLFNFLAALVLTMCGIPQAHLVLQKWAAIISKFASDCVAGVIEGLADRAENMRNRRYDCRMKIDELFHIYARLELLYPETTVLEMLDDPENMLCVMQSEELDFQNIIIIHVLDLMYFWMYLPRARNVIIGAFKTMNAEQKRIFVRSQNILKREKEISQLFLNGLVGNNFAGSLAFYLSRYKEYLAAIKDMEKNYSSPWSISQPSSNVG